MSSSRILIDWVSFTVEVGAPMRIDTIAMNKFLDRQLHTALGELWIRINENFGGWELSSGRAPYSGSYQSKEGVTLFFNARLEHCLIEISGRGCEYLRSIGLLERLIAWQKQRITRIDIAVDMTCETSPKEFVRESQSARFKSRQSVSSESGFTEYIGSRNSERYCRVYRYSPPHPRSAFLRAEMVFRKQNAKLFVEQAIECDWDMTALALGAGQIYGFEHPSWDVTGDEIPLASWTPEREQGKTVRWLCSQVAPAFKRLVEEGVIDDPEAFLREWFLGG